MLLKLTPQSPHKHCEFAGSRMTWMFTCNLCYETSSKRVQKARLVACHHVVVLCIQ